jgi:hypothetical protein
MDTGKIDAGGAEMVSPLSTHGCSGLGVLSRSNLQGWNIGSRSLRNVVVESIQRSQSIGGCRAAEFYICQATFPRCMGLISHDFSGQVRETNKVIAMQ